MKTILFTVMSCILLSGCGSGFYRYPASYSVLSDPTNASAHMELTYKQMDGIIATNVWVKFFQYSEEGYQIEVNSLDSTILLEMNNNQLHFKKEISNSGFTTTKVPINPKMLYTIKLRNDQYTLESYVKIPAAFDIKIKDTIDISEGLNIQWNNPFPGSTIHAFIEIQNPSDPTDKIIIADTNIKTFTDISLPKSVAPFVDQWIGTIRLTRQNEGIIHSAFKPGSYIIGKVMYEKRFKVIKN